MPRHTWTVRIELCETYDDRRPEPGHRRPPGPRRPEPGDARRQDQPAEATAPSEPDPGPAPSHLLDTPAERVAPTGVYSVSLAATTASGSRSAAG